MRKGETMGNSDSANEENARGQGPGTIWDGQKAAAQEQSLEPVLRI